MSSYVKLYQGMSLFSSLSAFKLMIGPYLTEFKFDGFLGSFDSNVAIIPVCAVP